jgi:hypothetical protein
MQVIEPTNAHHGFLFVKENMRSKNSTGSGTRMVRAIFECVHMTETTMCCGMMKDRIAGRLMGFERLSLAKMMTDFEINSLRTGL